MVPSVHWAAGAMGIVTGMTKNMFAVFRFRIELLLGAAALGMVAFQRWARWSSSRMASDPYRRSCWRWLQPFGIYAAYEPHASHISPLYAAASPD